MDCSTPGLPVHHQLPEYTQTHVHQVSDAIQPSHPLSSPSPPTFNLFHLSQHQGLFKWVSSLHQVAKVLGVPASHPEDSQESSPTPQFKSINSLALSFLYSPQLSHPYMTTGKTIALTRWTFVGKVMSLLFNMLSRLVIAFLPRNKCLLISWLQSPSAVIFEPKKIKSLIVSSFPVYLPWSDGTRCHDLSFLNVEF